MDYADAAKRLIEYSGYLARGPLAAAREAESGAVPVLRFLAEHADAEVTPSELAERCGYSRSRMTRILDALAAKGYLARRVDSRDRRRVLVRATERGVRAARHQVESGVDAVARELSALDEGSVAELLYVLERACTITHGTRGASAPL